MVNTFLNGRPYMISQLGRGTVSLSLSLSLSFLNGRPYMINDMDDIYEHIDSNDKVLAIYLDL